MMMVIKTYYTKKGRTIYRWCLLPSSIQISLF